MWTGLYKMLIITAIIKHSTVINFIDKLLLRKVKAIVRAIVVKPFSHLLLWVNYWHIFMKKSSDNCTEALLDQYLKKIHSLSLYHPIERSFYPRQGFNVHQLSFCIIDRVFGCNFFKWASKHPFAIKLIHEVFNHVSNEDDLIICDLRTHLKKEIQSRFVELSCLWCL